MFSAIHALKTAMKHLPIKPSTSYKRTLKSFAGTMTAQREEVSLPLVPKAATIFSRSKSTVTINFIDRKGEKSSVEAAIDDTLLDVVIDNDLELDSFGVCEGTLACSTCHVILDEPIFEILQKRCEPTSEEIDMLDLACGLTETSRLGCQVEIDKDMEGCAVYVPKESTDAREL